MYTRAKEFQCQVLADEIIELADESRIGVIVTERSDGKRERKCADMVERSKLQVDARKWALAKLLPKKYGELQRTELAGGDLIPLGPVETRASFYRGDLGPTKSEHDPAGRPRHWDVKLARPSG